ncbi:hypothetical protein [Rhizobium sp. LjRoot254]|uniref:hypothetical protein n=1 Tax=Rhizobium sp. LjRoot254 TaxID=3342297 RepID=UPI003ECF6423
MSAPAISGPAIVAAGPRSSFKQIDVERAIKGALKAGMIVHEIIASADGIRVVTHPSAAKVRPAVNEWDEVFDDGAQE